MRPNAHRGGESTSWDSKHMMGLKAYGTEGFSGYVKLRRLYPTNYIQRTPEGGVHFCSTSVNKDHLE